MSQPIVLPHSQVRVLQFSRDSNRQEGIVHEGIIYELKATFELEQHRECFRLVQELAQEFKVVLTTDLIRYRVWAEVKGAEVELK